MIGRDARRRARRERVEAQFGGQAEAALDVLALADLGWHDTYGDLEVPEAVLADVLLLSRDLPGLISTVMEALMDWRDVRVSADLARGE